MNSGVQYLLLPWTRLSTDRQTAAAKKEFVTEREPEKKQEEFANKFRSFRWRRLAWLELARIRGDSLDEATTTTNTHKTGTLIIGLFDMRERI